MRQAGQAEKDCPNTNAFFPLSVAGGCLRHGPVHALSQKQVGLEAEM